MKQIALLLIALVLSGCVIHLDNPPERKLEGTIVDGATGKPISDARVVIWSGRKKIMTPGLSYPHSGLAYTDEHGNFKMTFKDSFPLELTVSKNPDYGMKFVLEEEVDEVFLNLTEGVKLYE